MNKCWLIALALPLMAAAPQRQLTLALPYDTFGQPQGPAGARSGAPSSNPSGAPSAPARFQPAPLPNRNLNGPTGPRASSDPTLGPTVFSSRQQYRGDGFSRGSSAQNEQERNMKPPVGFSLHMPFTPQ